MNRTRPPNGPNRQPGNNNGGGWSSALDGVSPWLVGAGGLFASSMLFPGGGGGLSGVVSALPFVIVGGAVLGVVSVLKK